MYKWLYYTLPLGALPEVKGYGAVIVDVVGNVRLRADVEVVKVTCELRRHTVASRLRGRVRVVGLVGHALTKNELKFFYKSL